MDSKFKNFIQKRISNPIHKGWSVYTHSCCKYCSDKVIILLDLFDLPHNIIDCEDCFLIPEIQDEFKEFLSNLCGRVPGNFPLVFKDDEYIGGYNETLFYLKNNLN